MLSSFTQTRGPLITHAKWCPILTKALGPFTCYSQSFPNRFRMSRMRLFPSVSRISFQNFRTLVGLYLYSFSQISRSKSAFWPLLLVSGKCSRVIHPELYTFHTEDMELQSCLLYFGISVTCKKMSIAFSICRHHIFSSKNHNTWSDSMNTLTGRRHPGLQTFNSTH